MITSVTAEIVPVVIVTLTEDDGTEESITLKVGDMTEISYIKDRKLNYIKGKVVKIIPINDIHDCYISIDGSEQYSSKSVMIKASSIRKFGFYDMVEIEGDNQADTWEELV